MSANHLIEQYPIAISILEEWLKISNIEKLETGHELFQILFPPLDLLTDDDILQLRRNIEFLSQVNLVFNKIMLYYGLYYDGSFLQIINLNLYKVHFIMGTSLIKILNILTDNTFELDATDPNILDLNIYNLYLLNLNELDNLNLKTFDPSKLEDTSNEYNIEHIRIGQILQFLRTLKLMTPYQALKDISIYAGEDYPEYILPEILELWKES